MSDNFDYKKVLIVEKLLEINNLIDGINAFYSQSEPNYYPCHNVFNSGVYALEIKHKSGKGYPFGRLCSISSNPIINLNNQEIFEIKSGIVKFPNNIYISMNQLIFQKKVLHIQKDSKFDLYFELLSKIENAINKEILSFTNFEFFNKHNEISVQLRIKIFISGFKSGSSDYKYEDVIEINNVDFNDEKYWKTICFKIMPSVFNGIDEDYVKNSPTEDMLEQLKLLNY